MKLLASLKDDEFINNGIDVTRNIVRAIVLDENDNIALHHLFGVMGDAFGLRDYYETPGGGVDEGETFKEAIKRECLEELGYEIEIISEIGEVDDYYNALRRKNLNHYYLCRRIGKKHPTNFISEGDRLIEKTVWVSFNEAKALYDAHKLSPLSRLVYNREYVVLLEAESIVKDLRQTL